MYVWCHTDVRKKPPKPKILHTCPFREQLGCPVATVIVFELIKHIAQWTFSFLSSSVQTLKHLPLSSITTVLLKIRFKLVNIILLIFKFFRHNPCTDFYITYVLQWQIQRVAAAAALPPQLVLAIFQPIAFSSIDFSSEITSTSL